MVFSALSPFSLLFVLFVVSNGQYVQFALAGSLVMSLVGYGLSLGQDISFYKTEYKIQDMFVASPVSSLTYMTGLALSELLFGLPALGVLAFLVLNFGTSLSDLPLLISTIFLVWGSMSAIGFFLSSHMLHLRNATQIISFVNVVLAGTASSLLFHNKASRKSTIYCLPSAYYTRIPNISINYGPSYSKGLVHSNGSIRPNCIFNCIHRLSKNEGVMERIMTGIKLIPTNL